MTKPEILELDLADITIDQKFQPRVDGLNEDHVAELMFSYEMPKCTVPPPVVWIMPAVGNKKPVMYGISYHRFEALARLGRRSAYCEVRRGTENEAIVDAASSDMHHGLKRTEADRRRAVKMVMLANPDWSAARIASTVGLSEPTIARYITKDIDLQKIDRSVVVTVEGKRVKANRENRQKNAQNQHTKKIKNDPSEPQPKPVSKPYYASPDDSTDQLDEPETIPAKPVGKLEVYHKNDGLDEMPGVYRPRFTKSTNGQEVVLDALGKPCPAAVGDTFAEKELRRILADFIALSDEAERLRKDFMELKAGRKPSHNFTWANIPIITSHIDKARDEIVKATDELRESIPYVVCPKCHGERSGCKPCKQTGYWPRQEYEFNQHEFKKDGKAVAA